MNKDSTFVIGIVILVHSISFSTGWEMGLKVIDSNSNLVSRYIRLYKINDHIAPYRDGYSSMNFTGPEGCGNINGICDINGDEVGEEFYIWTPIIVTDPADTFELVINASDGFAYYCKMRIPYNENGGASNDFVVTFTESSGSFDICWNPRNTSILRQGLWPYITIDQKLSNGITSISQIGIWNQQAFIFDLYNVPVAIDILTTYTDHTLKATTIIHNLEKYNNWDGLSDVKNPNTYYLSTSRELSFNSNLQQVVPIFIQTNINNGNDGEIYFKDPWLIDSTHAIYGPMNRGTDAIFHKLLSPYNIDLDSTFQGVFLDQNENFSENYPIYSLKAPKYYATTDAIYEFSQWTGTNGEVEFDASGAYTTTARQTDVVFLTAGATVTAEYTPVNQIENYTLTITPEDTLAIPAGANITFAEGFALEIMGSLVADGSSEAITFTGPGRDATINYNGALRPPDPTSWFITVNGANAQLTLRNITLDNYYGVLSLNDYSKVTLEDVTISKTNQALSIGKLINDDIILSGISISNATNGIVFPSVLDANTQISHILIERCIFSDIDDYGVFLFQEAYSNANSAIYLTLGYSTFYNVGNSSHGGHSIYIDDLAGHQYTDVILDIQSTIFSQTSLSIQGSSLNFSENYNLTDQCECSLITHNRVTGDPLFNNPINGDYHLTAGSPAIDMGSYDFCMLTLPDYNCYLPFEAYEYELDPDLSRADIGAYYFDKIPGKPTNFSIINSNGHPKLTWTAPPDQDIQHYEIYRRLTDQGPGYSLIATVPSNQTNYTDLSIYITSGSKFTPDACYYVKTVDLISQSSPGTSIICKPYVAGKEMVLDEGLIPEAYGLYNNFPNPFNPVTTILYDLPERSHVSIDVYNTRGQRIATLVSGEYPAGYRSVKWIGVANNGVPVATGVYLYTISAQSLESDKVYRKKKKMILMK